ncbi:adenylate/guanylate cyclase domain-containing protein [Actomonas aquatica]|uniref:Adenylate/guanylate cyclase domain-containing protein n=1 Tax=Actomonas aquatica TaxID=2866162 RepID=A0ABZ1C985_9BACT|nr:adenylate/guanylate cyclase domain-containing protein [Opitutus sp. WL0086]WRQ88053.1 adenylate/guanylate cyclase domain-containing protein [Opitutus sp. WL0086]
MSFATQGAERLENVSGGRVAPALDDLTIGTGREVKAAISFFDIRGFTKRTSVSDSDGLKRTLFMLNLVIPTMMQIVYDHGGYIEKNTGDGIMAVFGVGKEFNESSNFALDAAVVSFYALKNWVNPILQHAGIPDVEARIGIDAGTLLLSRIGMASGSAAHQRNFLTAIGPAANIASKLQGKAGTNEIWVSALIKSNAHDWRQAFFKRKDEGDTEWTWVHKGTNNRYTYWHYNATRSAPDC